MDAINFSGSLFYTWAVLLLFPVEKVARLLDEQNLRHAIYLIVDNLKKIHPGTDGNPAKVKGLSLAIPSGECFGMLGPNGAGKTSFISMMINWSHYPNFWHGLC
ncbi:hypothetical protein QQ045_023168 [Rhodiola kirilowii]